MFCNVLKSHFFLWSSVNYNKQQQVPEISLPLISDHSHAKLSTLSTNGWVHSCYGVLPCNTFETLNCLQRFSYPDRVTVSSISSTYSMAISHRWEKYFRLFLLVLSLHDVGLQAFYRMLSHPQIFIANRSWGTHWCCPHSVTGKKKTLLIWGMTA